ncbi:MAG: CoA-binding protein [Promethearchaeota archaeon]
MDTDNYDFDKFDTLFNPKHIAFIGASERSQFGAMMYLNAFKESKWADTFYPVNPNKERIMDWKCYASIKDIPFPVDTAYLSVKTQIIPQVVKECVEKQVAWVIAFASGFSETGNLKGKILEQELLHIIKGSKTRIIGPNCLGPFNVKNGMAFSFASMKGAHGGVSFMSQSGGHLSALVHVGFKRDIRFRYGVSFGNQIDLNCVDFTKHYRLHSKTKLIAAYLESFGSAKGQDLLKELNKTTLKKPVIIWKGGHTKDGSRAAFSHTGAIASNQKLWEAIAKQTGSILVKDNEEFWNTIKTFELLYPQKIPKGRSIGIITPGGGASVNLTDLFASQNLKVPILTSESQEKLSQILPKENVNIENPIDLGATGFVIDVFTKCIEIVMQDPNIDIIVIPLWSDQIYSYVIRRMIKLEKKTPKPMVFCPPAIADSPELAKRFDKSRKYLHRERVPYYFDLRDAAISLSHLCDYADFLKRKYKKEKEKN